MKWTGIVLLAVALGAAPGCKHDWIHVSKPDDGADAEIGILYDGKRGHTEFQDRVLVMRSTRARIRNVSPRATLDTIYAFRFDCRPAYRAADWTPEEEIRGLDLIGPVKLPLRFHALPPLTRALPLWSLAEGSGDPSMAITTVGTTLGDKMLADLVTANAILQKECAGVELVWEEHDDDLSVSGLTGDSTRDAALAFAAQPERNVLHVYYSSYVDVSEVSGRFVRDAVTDDDPDHETPVLVIGYLADPTLLVHEVGHALSLAHTDGCPGFDSDAQTNIMDKDAGLAELDEDETPLRRYVSEGQTLRAHMTDRSILHNAHLFDRVPRADVEPSNIQARVSGKNEIIGDYPPACWRIWADGSMDSSKGVPADSPCAHGRDQDAVIEAMTNGLCRDVTEDSGGDLPLAAYLAPGCRDGDLRDLDAMLERTVNHGGRDATERTLLRTMDRGLTPAQAQRIGEGARRLDVLRRAWLDSPAAARTLPPAAHARARLLTGRVFEKFVVLQESYGRRSRAMRGLIVMGSAAGRARVLRAAQGPDPILAASARRALAAD